MLTINRLLTDHFRCPEGDVVFECHPRGESSNGYFRFGDDIVCYAQSSDLPLAQTAGEQLHDALNDVRIEESRLVLPFDPAHIIEDLRRERYAQNPHLTVEGNAAQRLIRRAYYGARPYLPVPVRKHLQRIFLASRSDTDFPEWPVDCTVDRLLEKLLALSMKAQGLQRIPFIWFWPEGHSSAAIMTHDVEMRNGVLSCSALMDLDEGHGIRSSFQFIPESRYRIPYSLLSEIRHRGFEINIHDLNHDGRLYWTREEFVRRAAKINRCARELGANGFRAGVLYRNLDWYDAFDFSYDMSVPNVGHLSPQAGGCCTVMPYFVGRILELPLTTAEDYLLFQILGEYSTNLWQLQIELIHDRHGLISLLTHPDYLGDRRASETYRALLSLLSQLRSEKGLWIALPGEVNEWWRARSQMTLVEQDGTWQIHGTGSERARIAHAHLEGDSIRYTIDRGSTQPASSRHSIHSGASSDSTSEDPQTPIPDGPSISARRSVAKSGQATDSTASRRAEFGRHTGFAILCALSGLALSRPLIALARLAYHSDYYSHTVVIPLLVAYMVFLKRKTVLAGSKPSLRLGAPLLAGGLLLFTLERWALPSVGPANHLSVAILCFTLLWMGSFGLCYGSRAFRTALFPLLLLLLMVPLPIAAMDDFIHVTRVGSAEVAAAIFGMFHVPVLRNGFLFIFPGISIEVAKECSGIHSTLALFVLTLMCSYLFLKSSWKRALMLLCVFPIVSVTNGLRIATLSLLAEYVDKNILYSRLHHDGGVLFFLLAFGLMVGALRLLSASHHIMANTRSMQHPISSTPGEAGITLRGGP